SVKELQEAGLCSRSSLGSQKLQASQHVLQILQIHHKLLEPERCPLSYSGGLGRLEVREGQSGKLLVPVGEIRQLCYHVHDLLSHQLQRLGHDDDVRVVPHVAGCGSQVDDALCLG